MLAALIDNAAFVAGIDRSREMVESASTKFSAAVANGRAEFRQGNVEAIPFGNATFGKACTINTIYFWTSLEAGFAEIRRVLVPGGRFVVGFLPKEWMDRLDYPSDIFTSRSPTQVATSLTGVGFKAVRVARPQRATRWSVIVAQ